MKYRRIFEPIKLGDTLFKNRLFAAPTGVRDFTADGQITDSGIAYYERKAIGGAAAVTVGECNVDSVLGMHGTVHLTTDDPRHSNSYCRLANSIGRHGAVASAELMHAGWAANRTLDPPGPAYAPVEREIMGRIVPAMTEEVMERTIERFARGAAFMKRCGFGMVTIHGGHGWLFSQWMSPLTNTRKDKWGGPDPANRMRFPLAIIDAVRKAVGPGFPIEFRMSGSECWDGGYDIETGVEIARLLDGHVDLIHVSAGVYDVEEAFTITHPSMFLPDGVNVKYAAEIKKHVAAPVATVGALGEPELMEEILRSGQADVLEIARGLIADPDLPNKLRGGREGEVKKCLRCLACFSTLLNTGRFYCAVNPETGREEELRCKAPAPAKKKVLVVGGGVAGMEAALACARRGHEVVLCEKTGRLGGVLNCEEKVPFKARLAEYLRRQEKLVREAGVDVRLNTEATPEYAEALGAEAVIAALGARPIKPDIKGIERAIPAEKAFAEPELTGDRVCIIGGGPAGVELGIYLAMLGKTVTIVEKAARLSDGGNFLHMKGVRRQMVSLGLDARCNASVLEIGEKGVECEGGFIEADTVVYAVGTGPLHEEAAAFSGCAPGFYLAGDCIRPGNIMSATATAFAAAGDIELF